MASVRPVQSASVPTMPRHVAAGSASDRGSSSSSLGGFPVNCLQKAGVFVQKIVTTTGGQAALTLVIESLFLFLNDNKHQKMNVLFSICFRHSDSRYQQLNRCAGEDHCWRKHSCYQGHKRYQTLNRPTCNLWNNYLFILFCFLLLSQSYNTN